MQGKFSYHLLITGFASVLLIMLLISIIGLTRMAVINRNLDEFVTKHALKTKLVTQMRTVARERSLLLNAMTIMEDPFERDDAFMRFNNFGNTFALMRNRLMAMNLSKKELTIINRQGQLTQTAVTLQNHVTELVFAGDIERARYALLNEAIPSQNKVLEQLQQLLSLMNRTTQSAVAGAARANDYAYVFMVILAVSGLMVGSGIAMFVIRRVNKIEIALHEEKERVEVTLHSIGDAVITTDADGDVNYLNPVAERLTGWDSTGAHGLALPEVFNIVNEDDRHPGLNPVAHCLQSGTIEYLTPPTVLISRSGDEYAIEDSAAPIRDRDGEVIGAVLVFHDVSLARRMARQLAWQANHDGLTGLTNRSAFEQLLEELLRSARDNKRQHALCFLDLDQFKVINDTCGHVAGDELLRQLAGVLRGSVRRVDHVARLGGDEFGILIEDCDLRHATAIAENIKNNISDFRFLWQDKTFDVGASIGMVALTESSESLTHMLSTADAACYLAKDKGRNRIHVYQPGDKELAALHGEMQWVSKITQAMEQNRFVIHAQQITPTREKQSGVFCELFAYLLDEKGQLVRPSSFLPAAERYALTPTIDRWMVRNTLHLLSRHPDSVLDTVAINLSGHSFCDEDFLSEVVGQFERYAVAPERVCFEITETAAIANLSRAARFICELSAMGCRFALDDFGSGLSSFAYLKSLRVDYLKIDGAFIIDIEHDPIDRAMVEAINEIGHVMGIKTIAEYVETRSILEIVTQMGIDYAQGFNVCEPKPLLDYLTTRKTGTKTK